MADDNRILIEELEKQLIWYRDEASVEEFDADAVDAICTMLQKLSPVEEPHRTKEEAYENILRQIRMEEEGIGEKNGAAEGEESDAVVKGDKKRRSSAKKSNIFFGKRRALAAVVAIVVIGIFTSLNSVAYAKENKSLFTMFLERVGVLKIEKEPGVEEGVFSSEERMEEFYNSWAELDQEVKRRIVVPEYVPDGYSLYGIRSWNSNDRIIIQSNYYDKGNGHILIEITLWEGNERPYRENATDEKTYVLLSEYSNNDTLYYKYEDEYICMDFRANSFYRMSGNVSLEEMIKIEEGLRDV